MGVKTIPYLTVGVQVIVRLNFTEDHDLPKGKSNNIKAIKGILQELLSEILWLKQDLRLDSLQLVNQNLRSANIASYVHFYFVLASKTLP